MVLQRAIINKCSLQYYYCIQYCTVL